MTLSKSDRRFLGSAGVCLGIGGICLALSFTFQKIHESPLGGQMGFKGAFVFLIFLASVAGILLGPAVWQKRS